jgi:hypothetical protein
LGTAESEGLAMHTILDPPPRRVLRVLSGAGQNGAPDLIVGGTTEGRQLDFEPIENVYLALGRLVRHQGQSYAGVLVEVDGLDAEELEFFSHTARLFPRLPVYVHAATAAGRQRLPLAVALGASATIDAESLPKVLSKLEARASMPIHPAGVISAAGPGDGDGRHGIERASAGPMDGDRPTDMAVAFP